MIEPVLIARIVTIVAGTYAIKAATSAIVKRFWIIGLVLAAIVLGVLGHPSKTSLEYFSAIAQVIPVLFIAGIVESRISTRSIDPVGVLVYGATATIGESSALAAIAYDGSGHLAALLFWATTLASLVFMVSVVRRPVLEYEDQLKNRVSEKKQEVGRLRADLAER